MIEPEAELFEEICNKSMELCVNLGLFNTVLPHWPEHVQGNFVDREREILKWLEEQIDEVQQFAEAYDG